MKFDVKWKPEKEGCTYTALIQIAGVLEKKTESKAKFFRLEPRNLKCKSSCRKDERGRCSDRRLSGILGISKRQIIEFMDKFCSLAGKDMLLKPAAAIASARRAGTTATLDVLLKYFHSTRCQSFLPTIGIWYTATLRMKYFRTKKEFRSCMFSAKIWHGFCIVWKPEKCWNFKTGIRREGKDKLIR